MFDDIAFAVRHVLTSRERLAFLLRDGLLMPRQLNAFVQRIVPRAAARLDEIRALAASIPDARLRVEALSSIGSKAYHVAGGAILATFLPEQNASLYVDVIAPLETIYDYLDNLCDRHPDVTTDAYPVLHQAIADALDPAAPLREYYAAGPPGDDGGYLVTLVGRTRDALTRFHGYESLLPYVREAARLYAEMQTYKHYPPGERERACVAWYERHRARVVDLDWHEFTCAAGSQFQVYAPLFMLASGEAASVGRAYDAYFPNVAAIHVLLDAFIDQSEDREHGELNFVTCYDNPRALRERLTWLVHRSRVALSSLPNGADHVFVLRAMLLFYLTHPKVFAQGLDRQARAMLQAFDR